MFEEDFEPLAPVNYFQLSADCRQLSSHFPALSERNQKTYLLPDTSQLCDEESFAEVAIGWSVDGLEVFVKVNQPFTQSFYPEITRGDSVEVFIDTRDVKTSGFNTRFCHHFFFLPESIDGTHAAEITRFRTEDVHELCDSRELRVIAEKKWRRLLYNIWIPNQCLHGYDPAQFDRLGFTYRINRVNGSPQHFSVTTNDYQLEQQPSTWSSLNLVKEKK